MMLAEAFAMALQCEADGTDACMECRSCRQAVGRNQPDIRYVAHEKPNTISVEDIRRQLNQEIGVRPYSSRFKIYIVDEAEKMNVQAQNALLKTLEEPPGYAVILLLTTNADAFLPTIRSRSVTLSLKAVNDSDIRQLLMRQYGVPDYKADICVAFSQGVVGRALELVSSEDFNELKDLTMHQICHLHEAKPYELLDEAKQLTGFKARMEDYFGLLRMWYRDVLLYKASGSAGQLYFKDELNTISQQAGWFSYEGIQAVLHAVETARTRLRSNVNFELTIELLLLTIKENIA